MPAPTYSTTAFPDLRARGQSHRRYPTFTTFKSDPDDAADQLNTASGANFLWTYELGWSSMTGAEAASLYQAFIFCGGCVEGLDFFEWRTRVATDIYIGLGDGTANPITLPVKGAASLTTALRKNGVAMAGTFQPGTGQDGADRFLPAAAVAVGAVIRADFTGRRRRNLRFYDPRSFRLDIMPKTLPTRWTASAKLIETQGVDLL